MSVHQFDAPIPDEEHTPVDVVVTHRVLGEGAVRVICDWAGDVTTLFLEGDDIDILIDALDAIRTEVRGG